MAVLFYITSAVAVISTFMVITRLNATHALLYMIISLLSIAVIFFIIGAPFVAALEVIIYAGAIMVLFLFVIMMLNLGESENQEKKWLSGKIWIGPSLLSLILLFEFIYILLNTPAIIFNPGMIEPKQVGISLFTTYLFAVELTGMLLMSGIVGAYHLGREKKKNYHRFFNQGINE